MTNFLSDIYDVVLLTEVCFVCGHDLQDLEAQIYLAMSPILCFLASSCLGLDGSPSSIPPIELCHRRTL